MTGRPEKSILYASDQILFILKQITLISNDLLEVLLPTFPFYNAVDEVLIRNLCVY